MIEFPSPYGELHFSMKGGNMYQKYVKLFPSPYGELHFSICYRMGERE